MDLLFIIATFFILLSFCSAATAASSSKKAVATASTLHFYMHDTVGTTVVVANSSYKTSFGMVMVIDDKLTEGPSLDSEQVGRAQGMYLFDSLSELSLLLTFTAVFDNGTLSLHGQDATAHKTREVSVIGGTGAFRFATGYAVMTTNFFKDLYAILDVTVFLRQQ